MARTKGVLPAMAVLVAMLGACTGGTSDPTPPTTAPSASAPPAPDGARTLPCDDSIEQRDDLPEGYSAVLDAVALPFAPGSDRALQAVRDDQEGVPPFWSKIGLLVRADSGVSLEIDAPEREAVLGWGHAGDPDYFGTAITTSGCDGDGWLAFVGGFRVDDPRCLDLIVTTASAEQPSQVGVGAPCDGQQPPPL
ncbi:hypothetical protein [Salsipaludibacter albus]|uniref:hypothetical protein n=1 Tax=Salsipaludibacter albus TaxID=2849650 RepID=UPI001EE49705|nr:hypothetical protein [Salsipaludibacter albus]MBY5163631.1 hypothetical protein [Salsipaludibacter albus]